MVSGFPSIEPRHLALATDKEARFLMIRDKIVGLIIVGAMCSLTLEPILLPPLIGERLAKNLMK